ncbi:MAG: NnrU family protein [Hyphomicrobiaceae bacterium]|nr:NnrU family protein [Hyphomicrobiaceae bacterium]
MWMLIGGLALFFVVHLLPTRPQLRARLVARLGSGPYSGLFALVSLVALVLIVLGYGHMRGLGRENPQLWVPPSWSRYVTMLLMIPALILLVAAYVPSRMRIALRHPMLMAVMLWAFAHLLANGDLAAVLLFGSFLAYGLYDMSSANQRAALGPLGRAPGSAVGDSVAIAGGLALYGLLLVWGHQMLTGVPLLP